MFMSYTFISNCLDEFDCDGLVVSLRGQEGVYRNAKTPYGNPGLFEHPKFGDGIKKMAETWKSAGYLDNDSVEYINYFPGQHYDNSFTDRLSSLLNLRHCRSWISSIRPGRCVPWHWDVEEKEDEYAAMGEVMRFTIFIDTPQVGQVFILDDKCFHMIPQGDIYKWNNWKDYHLGFNCGLDTKYLMHYIGARASDD